MKVYLLLVVLISLAIPLPVYAFTFVPPPRQTFVGGGIVYSIGYECFVPTLPTWLPPANQGTLATGYLYLTAILIHNKLSTATTVYIKILDAYNNLSIWAKNPTTSQYPFLIQPDGALFISCGEIIAAEGFAGAFPPSSKPAPFLYGFIVLSQPGAITALDVVVTYQWMGVPPSCPSTSDCVAGVAQNTVIYSGTPVAHVPSPCVPTFSSSCPTPAP